MRTARSRRSSRPTDAVIVDTTGMPIDAVVAKVLAVVQPADRACTTVSALLHAAGSFDQRCDGPACAERTDAASTASIEGRGIERLAHERRPVSSLGINMTESFAELFEQSQHRIAKLKPGRHRLRHRRRNPHRRRRDQCRPEVRRHRPDRAVQERRRRARSQRRRRGQGRPRRHRKRLRRDHAVAREGQALDGVGRAGRGARQRTPTITGRISGKVKGGFTVDIKDVRAFLPGSLVDVRPVRDPAYLEGKELEFKIIKLDRKRNNVVVSRRAVVESEFSRGARAAARAA